MTAKLPSNMKAVLSQPHLIKAELCRRNFYYFLQEFWHTIIPADPVWNWHLKYLCDELQQVAHKVMAGQVKEYDLIINIPPGTSKSTIVTQMLPAWCWIASLPRDDYEEAYNLFDRKQLDKPENERETTLTGGFLRFISASYSSALSLEHADLCRDIVRSDKYLLYFPEINIRRDKAMKSNYKLNKGGTRFSTSVGGTVTGTHAHIILLDDPLNPKEAVSDVERKSANDWVDHTLSTRKVSKEVTVTIVIMQRLHEEDTTGHLLDKIEDGKRIKHICLPGELPSVDTASKRTGVQPKELEQFYTDGLLDPVRMSRSVLREMEADLGQYGYAGQVEQSPSPPEGGMFKVGKIQVVNAPPSKIIKTVRYWDKAGTDKRDNKNAPYTAGIKMSKMADGCFLIHDSVRGQWEANEREQNIKQTAQIDGVRVLVYTEQEPGSGGKESAQSTIRNLAGFRIFADRPTGNKIFRADPFSVQVNAGNVYMMRGDWNRPFIEELRHFPMGKFKDQTDAASAGFAKLTTKKTAGTFAKKKR